VDAAAGCFVTEIPVTPERLFALVRGGAARGSGRATNGTTGRAGGEPS
jgi:hypothetical protein